jgi:hypothetical protein
VTTWINNSGLISAQGIDSNGCKNTGLFSIPELPDFCGFMCGCYQDCIEQGQTYSFPAGVSGSYALWHWEEYISGSWTVVTSGSGVVPDYTTSTPGTHPLRLYVENYAGCGDYSCETDLTLTQCPDKGCEVGHAIKDIACKQGSDGDVIYTFNLALNFATFGEPCEKYEITITPPFGSMTGSPTTVPAGSHVLAAQWNTGMSYYPGGVVCFDVQILNTCDSSICTFKTCMETEPCGNEIKPCEGEIVMAEISCKASFNTTAVYYFSMSIEVVPFGDPCDEYLLTIATPSGSISTLSTTTVYAGSNTVTGLWDTGVTSFSAQEVCFTVTLTNGCNQRDYCDQEICFEVPDCKAGVNGTGTSYSSDAISIFPNPAQDQVNIQFPSQGKYDISILNTRGETVRHYTLGANAFTSYPFDVRELPDGVYIIRCVGNDFTSSKTIILRD